MDALFRGRARQAHASRVAPTHTASATHRGTDRLLAQTAFVPGARLIRDVPGPLEQLDIAVTALDSTVPANFSAVMKSLRQNTLILDGQVETLLETLGSERDENGAPNPSGMYATMASLQTLYTALQTSLTALQALQGADAAAITSLLGNILSIDNVIAGLDTRISALEATP
jgi:hypothetical protein